MSGKTSAIIFDIGGTLFDLHCQHLLSCLQRALGQETHYLLPLALLRRDMGLRKEQHIEKLLQTYAPQHNNNQTISRIVKAFEQSQPDQADFIPGAIPTLQQLKKMGLRIGCTTGYNQTILQRIQKRLIDQHDIQLDAAVSSDDCNVLRSRPFPDMMWHIMKQLSIDDVKRVIKVDDSIPGLQEGLAAGCSVVAVLDTSVYMGQDNQPCNVQPHQKREYVRQCFISMGCPTRNIISSVADLIPFLHENKLV